jgi:hypothetical protein
MHDISKLALIGQGVFASVYSLTEDTVYRVGGDQLDGWKMIGWLTDEEREFYCLPKVYSVDEEEGNWAVVEKLYPVGSALFQDFGDRDWSILNLHQKVIIDIGNEQLKALLDKAIAAFHYLKEKGYPIQLLDIHPRNIMKRKDGTLVLSDPFGELDI